MATPTQLIEIPFSAGLKQGQRTELLDPKAGFTTLENVRQPARGAVSKRYGFTALTLSRSDGTSRSSGHKLLALGDGIGIVGNDSRLDIYAPGAASNVPRGRVPNVACRAMDFVDVPRAATTSAIPFDVVYCNGYFVASYRLVTSPDTVYTAVVDAATGAVVSITPNSTDGTFPVLATYSTYVLVFYLDVSLGDIFAQYIDLTSATSAAAGWLSANSSNAIATDASMSAQFSVESLSDRVAVAYINTSAGTDRATVKTCTIAAVLETATINTNSTTPDYVAVAGGISDTLWVAWNQGSNVRVIGLDADALANTLATQSQVIATGTTVSGLDVVPSATAGKGRLLVNTSTPGIMVDSFSTSAGAVSADGVGATMVNVQFAGRAFRQDGRYYVHAYQDANSQASCILVDVTDGNVWLRPVANPIDMGLATTVSIGNQPQTRVTANSANGRWYWITTIQKTGVTTGIVLVEYDFAARSRTSAVDHNGTVYLSGGILTYFDGQRVAEVGFLCKPTMPTAGAGGTGITLTNGRRYVAVYEEIDADGNWCQSGISDPSASTGAVTNKTITVTTTPLVISARYQDFTTAGRVRVAVYGTLDSNNNLPPYYRVGAAQVSLSAATVAVEDALSDATLGSQAKLYSPNLPSSVGGALDRRAPVGLAHVVSYNGMLVGAENGNVRWSGQHVPGEAAWFSPAFQIPVPGAGDITALAVQDGTLFAFKRRSIHALTGEIPADNYSAGGLGSPRRLATEVGCIDANSIAVTTLGIFFQSERGIELLTRGQSVEYIGADVQDELASRPVVAAATVDVDQALVYFELASSESSGLVSGTGRTLVYDLTLRAWISTDRRTNNAGTADTPAQSAAMVYTGSAWRYAWLGTEGRVYVEDRTTYLDPGSAWITMRAETGWIRAAGIQAQQMLTKVLLLAKKSTRANILAYLAYDYASTYKSAQTWAANDIDTLSSALERVQVAHRGHDENEGQAFRIKLEDATPTGGTVSTGQGATWIALTADVTPRPGAAEVPESAT